MSVFRLSDDQRSQRELAQKALGSYWVNAYLGLYLTPDERERFRGLDPADVLDLTAMIGRMRKRGFDRVLAREVRRAVLAPGEPDTPVTPRAAAGALYGPPASPAPAPGRPAAPRPGAAHNRRKGRRREDPGQRLLAFMTPVLLAPDEPPPSGAGTTTPGRTPHRP